MSRTTDIGFYNKNGDLVFRIDDEEITMSVEYTDFQTGDSLFGATIDTGNTYIPGIPQTYGNGVAMSPDGTRVMYSGSYILDYVYEHVLSTPYDLTTATYTGYGVNFDGASQVEYGNNGNTLYITSNSFGSVRQYNLNTPYTLSGGWGYAGQFNPAEFGISIVGMSFSSDGTIMVLGEVYSDSLYEYNLSTPWSVISGVSFVRSWNISLGGASPGEHDWNSDGTKLYINQSSRIAQYAVSTPYSLSPAPVFEGYWDVDGGGSKSGLSFTDSYQRFVMATFNPPSLQMFDMPAAGSNPVITVDRSFITNGQVDRPEKVIVIEASVDSGTVDDFTAELNTKYIVDSSLRTGGVITMILPSANRVGDTITVSDMKGDFAVGGNKNVITSTALINGVSQTWEFDVANTTTKFTWTGIDYGWKVVVIQP